MYNEIKLPGFNSFDLRLSTNQMPLYTDTCKNENVFSSLNSDLLICIKTRRWSKSTISLSSFYGRLWF